MPFFFRQPAVTILDSFFSFFDEDKDNALNINDSISLFKRSGLDNEVLEQLWDAVIFDDFGLAKTKDEAGLKSMLNALMAISFAQSKALDGEVFQASDCSVADEIIVDFPLIEGFSYPSEEKIWGISEEQMKEYEKMFEDFGGTEDKISELNSMNSFMKSGIGFRSLKPLKEFLHIHTSPEMKVYTKSEFILGMHLTKMLKYSMAFPKTLADLSKVLLKTLGFSDDTDPVAVQSKQPLNGDAFWLLGKVKENLKQASDLIARLNVDNAALNEIVVKAAELLRNSETMVEASMATEQEQAQKLADFTKLTIPGVDTTGIAWPTEDQLSLVKAAHQELQTASISHEQAEKLFGPTVFATNALLANHRYEASVPNLSRLVEKAKKDKDFFDKESVPQEPQESVPASVSKIEEAPRTEDAKPVSRTMSTVSAPPQAGSEPKESSSVQKSPKKADESSSKKHKRKTKKRTVTDESQSSEASHKHKADAAAADDVQEDDATTKEVPEAFAANFDEVAPGEENGAKGEALQADFKADFSELPAELSTQEAPSTPAVESAVPAQNSASETPGEIKDFNFDDFNKTAFNFQQSGTVDSFAQFSSQEGGSSKDDAAMFAESDMFQTPK